MLSLCSVVPLIIVILAFLVGLAVKQYNPTSNTFATGFIWCFIFAVVWLLYCVLIGHVIVR